MIPSDLSPLANHLWQSTLFGIVAWLLTLVLRPNRAATRYWIWLTASAKFLVPFSLLSGIFRQLAWRPVRTIADPHFTNAAIAIGRPFAPLVDVPIPSVAAPSFHYLPAILLSVWLIGCLISAMFLLRTLGQIRKIRCAATPLDLDLPIPVMSSSAQLEPGVFGIWKPTVLLPSGMTDRLEPAQLEALLAHEMCHVRRKDNLTAAIHMIVETIYWFHPLLWWTRVQLVAERERACDEEVLELGCEPQMYAQAILKVCTLCIESPLVCVSGVTGGGLRRRIEAIIANRAGERLNGVKKLLLAGVGAAALAGPIAIGVSYLPAVQAQAPQSQNAAARTFEAASIKLSRADRLGGGLNLSPNRIRIVNSPLKFCVQAAWNLRDFQVSGATGWIGTERYDIDAVSASPFAKGEFRTMLQVLLVERFGLVVHHEARDTEGFALVIGRTGPKLPTSSNDPDIMFSHTASGDMTLKARSATLKQLAEALSTTLGVPVVDQTGIDGQFDLSLQWTPDPETRPRILKSGAPAPAPPPDAIAGPSLFAAVQEKLGLKLEARKVPAEVLIIDHANRPSEN
jgi:bla regulator protein BlaR1